MRWLRWTALVSSAAGAGFVLSLVTGRVARSLEVPSSTFIRANAVTHTKRSASRVVLLVHGGAGTLRKADITPAEERANRAALTEALQAGYAILRQGGRSLDAVVAAIKVDR